MKEGTESEKSGGTVFGKGVRQDLFKVANFSIQIAVLEMCPVQRF